MRENTQRKQLNLLIARNVFIDTNIWLCIKFVYRTKVCPSIVKVTRVTNDQAYIVVVLCSILHVRHFISFDKNTARYKL